MPSDGTDGRPIICKTPSVTGRYKKASFLIDSEIKESAGELHVQLGIVICLQKLFSWYACLGADGSQGRALDFDDWAVLMEFSSHLRSHGSWQYALVLLPG